MLWCTTTVDKLRVPTIKLSDVGRQHALRFLLWKDVQFECTEWQSSLFLFVSLSYSLYNRSELSVGAPENDPEFLLMQTIDISLILKDCSEILDFGVFVSELTQTDTLDLTLWELEEIVLFIFVDLFHLFYNMIKLVHVLLRNVAYFSN